MPRPLLLVAASGLAEETIDAVRAAGSVEVVGVLDDDSSRHGHQLNGVTIVGGLAEALALPSETSLVVCAGRGTVRRNIVARLTGMGIDQGRFATVVHPSVEIPRSCRVGEGSILLAGSVMTASVTLGRHVVVMPNTVLTHGDVVDDFATLCAGVRVGGNARVATAAYIGMGAMLREQVVVGSEATVGMGAVVLFSVPAGETWVGVPAHKLAPSGVTGPGR